ncbi:hypothetical protein SORBI_3002G148350 [Sorghum bicolor]|uniref:Uncharacterized protein n=1 Tax=Sorghum bicolor TaxID=4558 RepID=A0A1W0W436_SORBI|nr:hypothetical protein SORBI_3002G148350 [Sorghum bicolor]
MDEKHALVDIDHHRINFASLLKYKVKCGYSARDFMYYMKRCDNDTALLHRIDYEEDALTMIEECTEEKTIRLAISTTEVDQDAGYAITPIKQRSTLEEVEDEDIDAYKVWLEKLPQDKENPEFKDDTRMNTVATYKEWLRREGLLQDIYAYTDDETIEEDGSADNSATPMQFPSHACRPKASKKGVGEKRKIGCGTLKGLSVEAKRCKLGTEKLNIEFSSTKGGPIGENHRLFVDEIVRFTRTRTPLIGVKKWGDIRWNIDDNDEEKARIWKIAERRYKGWRADLSATYNAYKSYHKKNET